MSRIRILNEQDALSQVEISLKSAAKFKRSSLKYYANGVTFQRDKWLVAFGCGKNNTIFEIQVGYGDFGEGGVLSYKVASSTDKGPDCTDSLVRKVLTAVSKAIDGSSSIYSQLAPTEFWPAFFDNRSSANFKLRESLLSMLSSAIGSVQEIKSYKG